MQYSREFRLHPLIVAAYGPPYHKIAELIISGPSDVRAGVYTLPVSASSGSLDNLKFPFDMIKETDGTQITGTGKWAYEGALMTSVNSRKGTITLAAKTAKALPIGTKLDVNELLYPSVSGHTADDPSVVAYSGGPNVSTGGYVGFIARSIVSAGLQGQVEIWNEPPWIHDEWDNRYRFYDSYPSISTKLLGAQFGFAAALITQTPPDGVRYNWAGTHKSGFNSLLGPGMSSKPTKVQIQNSISSESFHPYGNNPEDHAWDPACLSRATTANWIKCALPGSNAGSNIKYEALLDNANRAKFGWGIDRNITEIGVATTNQIAKARFNIRAFLTYLSLGFNRVNFYRLADVGANYGFVDSTTKVPQASYRAIANIIAIARGFAKNPVDRATVASLPSVVSFSGRYPLTVVQIIGARTKMDPVNTVLYASWQRSYATSGHWLDLPSPPTTPLTVSIPTGMRVKQVMDLVTLKREKYTQKDSKVTYDVSDNPVGLLLGP